MISLDTNVLIRVFMDEDDEPRQTKAARELVRREAPVLVNPIVLAEFVWTLRSAYRLDRAAIHARLAGIAAAPEFSLMFPEATRRAVDLFETGPADFSDYLVGEMDAETGCTTTFTFDRDAARGERFTEL
jgi:predicted nucleic-acid-binding protein